MYVFTGIYYMLRIYHSRMGVCVIDKRNHACLLHPNGLCRVRTGTPVTPVYYLGIYKFSGLLVWVPVRDSRVRSPVPQPQEPMMTMSSYPVESRSLPTTWQLTDNATLGATFPHDDAS